MSNRSFRYILHLQRISELLDRFATAPAQERSILKTQLLLLYKDNFHENALKYDA